MKMNLKDYIDEHSGPDWPKLLEHWHWRLPTKFTIWFANRFGDLFLVLDDGSVHRLGVGDGTLQMVAQNRNEFWEKLDDENVANDWLMIPVVDRLVAAGKTLRPGECYCYRLLPILGGGYGIDDFVVKDLAFVYASFGPIHERIKDLPEGTQIEFKVVD